MPLVLAIEPDPRQASILERVVREQVRADLVLVDSKDAALTLLATRIPDVILVATLVPPRDEQELTEHLNALDGASHVQTLTIPLLAADVGDETPRGGLLSVFRRKQPRTIGRRCDCTVFGEQVQEYLQRAAELRPAEPPHAEPEPAWPESDAHVSTAVDSATVGLELQFEAKPAGEPGTTAITEEPAGHSALPRDPVGQPASPEIDGPLSTAVGLELQFEAKTAGEAEHEAPRLAIGPGSREPLLLPQREVDAASTPAACALPSLLSAARIMRALAPFEAFLAQHRSDSFVSAYQLRQARAADVRALAADSVVQTAAALTVWVEAAETTIANSEGLTDAPGEVAVGPQPSADASANSSASDEVSSSEEDSPEQKCNASSPVEEEARATPEPLDLTPWERLFAALEARAPRPKPRAPQPAQDASHRRRSGEASRERRHPAGGAAPARKTSGSATARKPNATSDEWGICDRPRWGMPTLIARLESPRPGKESRLAPLAAWARSEGGADDADVAVRSPQPQPSSSWRDLVASLRLPDHVASVRYASGCRIRGLRVVPRKPATIEAEGHVVIISRKALEEDRKR